MESLVKYSLKAMKDGEKNLRKRTKKDIIQKAAPDLFGSRSVMARTNFVSFGVDAAVYNVIKRWIQNGDVDKLQVTLYGEDSKLKVIIINWREQRAYEGRGAGVHDNDLSHL